MTRVQKCRALRSRGMSVVEAEKSLARHAAWLILYPAAVQPCSLTDFACTVESFALAVCPYVSSSYLCFPQLAAFGARIVILTGHGPAARVARPKSSEDCTRGISNLRLASSNTTCTYCITHARQWQTWRHWPTVSRAPNCFFCVAAGSPITWARGLEGRCSLLFEDHAEAIQKDQKRGLEEEAVTFPKRTNADITCPDARIINILDSWLLTLDS
jgi:hypothetical protein